MRIIGLTGRAGAGKDTAAGFALDWCRGKVPRAARLAFADPLKVSAARALGFKGDHADCVAFCNGLKQGGVELYLHGPSSSELGPGRVSQKLVTGREYLQFYGTEAHRDVFGEDFWVEVMEKKLTKLAGAVDVVFITDVRFKNESQMICRLNGEIWEIFRPALAPVDSHVSEEGLPDGAIDFRLVNAGDLIDLQNLVEAACEANIR